MRLCLFVRKLPVKLSQLKGSLVALVVDTDSKFDFAALTGND